MRPPVLGFVVTNVKQSGKKLKLADFKIGAIHWLVTETAHCMDVNGCNLTKLSLEAMKT